MNIKRFFKYFLSLVLIVNSTLSLALSENCIKNIDFINDQETSKIQYENVNNCHKSTKHHDALQDTNINDIEDCFDCGFCSINNQISYFKINSMFSFSKLGIEKKQNVFKKFHSFIARPKGPPPKKII
tara:strand:+ start:1631 stop:2014 length:384 start_codon:yes stop_codon:yes gene_type:complete